jgi:FAD:protein FMN transferase
MTIGYYFWIPFILLKSFFFQNGNKLFSLSGFAQGTTYQVKYLASDSIITLGQVDSILNEIDLSLSLYRENSLINRFNQNEREIEMDKHMKEVVEHSLKTWKTTAGAFDISVKPLVDLWGFGPKGFSRFPEDSEVSKLLACTGSRHLQVVGRKLIKSIPCIQIDCNGIAQGYCVDVISEFISKNGIQNFLVELGGEIRVKGKNEKSDHWSIGTESPNVSEELFSPLVIQLSEGAITTSGNYRKTYSQNSKFYHHIIDPRTGFPSENSLVSVSVIAKNAITADAFDNAFMVMGRDSSLKFLDSRKDLEAYFIYRKLDGMLADTATRGFYSLVKD